MDSKPRQPWRLFYAALPVMMLVVFMLSASAQQVKNARPWFFLSVLAGQSHWHRTSLASVSFVPWINVQLHVAAVQNANSVLQSSQATQCARECAEDNCNGQFQSTCVKYHARVMQFNKIRTCIFPTFRYEHSLWKVLWCWSRRVQG